MTDKEFIDIFNNWKNSVKCQNIKSQLDKAHKHLIDNISYDSIYTQRKDNMLNEDFLNEFCETSFVFNKLKDEDKRYYENLNNTDIKFSMQYNQVLKEHIKIIMNLYFYIKFYSNKEEYEMCAKLRDCVVIQQFEFIRKILWYYPSKDEHKEMVADIITAEEKIKNKFI